MPSTAQSATTAPSSSSIEWTCVLFLGFLALPITFNVSQVSFDTGHSCTGYSYRRISTTSFYLCRQFIRLCLKRPRD